MATLLSVNVGRPHDVDWNGRVVHTGIWKRPTEGPVLARRLNLDGDGQGDLAGHGGEHRAVMVYQAESYDFWREFLGRSDLTWGIFGENFTVDGLPDDEVCIGDRYRIGEAEFEVTQPRVTCYRVAIRLREPQMPALLVAQHRPGFYFRVLTEGHVRSGDSIVQISAGSGQVSVAATDALLYLPDPDLDTVRRLLTVPALSSGWRGSFSDLVRSADLPRLTVSRPAWPGFRHMRVMRLVRETDLITSVYLTPTARDALPAPRPGQYLTIRIMDHDVTAVRSYSISAWAGDSYRISVKREDRGLVSAFIGSRLAVGDEVEVAAPRGEFVLGEGDEPVVLLSAGIGVTPVMAMLQRLAEQHSPRSIWWLHSTNSPTTLALSEDARRLMAALPAGHFHIRYTATESVPEELDEVGVGRGRWDLSALAELQLPIEASAYICGPTGFLDAMTAALTDLGFAADHLHTERFASLSAINPGIISAGHSAPHPPATPGSGPMVTFARAGMSAAFDESKGNLLEMAEECDVPTRWACRTGVCHTCATPLLSGTVCYQPAPLTEPDPGDVLLCCTRPTSDVVLDL